MQLGNFSLSLAVKDLTKSRDFYEKLGFSMVHGDPSQNWLILKSGQTIIGLFQGMFDKNMLTFNPGWDAAGKELESYTDIRDLQRQFKDAGLKVENEADEDSTGPASFMVVDPDGNPILFDQHV
ncbi:MAG: VOC family protein [Gammaproteobacteria bacterium]|nr:VOC family protein [Gammaproteobacteria bacterium]